MLKIKKNYIQIIIGACILIALAVYFQFPDPEKGIVAVLLGVGVSFALSGVISTVVLFLEARTPGKGKQVEIEMKDERNITIRNKAKAKASDISCWFIMVVVYLQILIDVPLWLTLVGVGAFLLHFLLYMALLSKYSKEM